MRWSQYFIPTLREDPADAEVVSHKLLLRAGEMARCQPNIAIPKNATINAYGLASVAYGRKGVDQNTSIASIP